MKRLKFEDRIYGQIVIEEPVILDLISTRPFQRLKEINQYGGVNFVYPDKYQISRFEHSIGVWWVLKTLGVNLETQVAGLLHDVGHTAFSHMVDMAMSDAGERFHELNNRLIVGWSEIDSVLRKSKLKIGEVDSYPEVKKSLPDIGADRLDYAIRDYVGVTGKKKTLGRKVLQNIALDNRNIVFTDAKVAREFALTGAEAMWRVIYEPSVAVVYQAIIEILRIGFKGGWIKEPDLFQSDKYLLDKFRANRHRLPSKYVDIFLKPFVVKKGTKNDHDFHHIKLKARYFDPYVLARGRKSRLSWLDKAFSQKFEKWVKIFEAGKTGRYYRVIF